MMKKTTAVLSLIVMLSACCHSQDPSRENFRKAVTAYLKQKGDLCLAKYDWPIIVTQQEAAAGTRDAVQMPVLEKLGLVSSSIIKIEAKAGGDAPATSAKRYALTQRGQQYYLKRPTTVAAAAGSEQGHPRDFCAAHLSLDKVVGWSTPVKRNGHMHTVVTYTYTIDAAPWTSSVDAKRVFPMVARIVSGAGVLQLREPFTLTENGWVSEHLVRSAAAKAQPTGS